MDANNKLIIHNDCGLPVELCTCKNAPVKYDFKTDKFIERKTMDSELKGREIYGHINGKFDRQSEAEMSLFIEELKKLMIRFDIVKIDICYSPEIPELEGGQ